MQSPQNWRSGRAAGASSRGDNTPLRDKSPPGFSAKMLECGVGERHESLGQKGELSYTGNRDRLASHLTAPVCGLRFLAPCILRWVREVFPSPNSALAFYFFSFILLQVRYSYWLISRLGRKEKKNIIFFSSLISLACRHRTCQSSKSMSDFLGT